MALILARKIRQYRSIVSILQQQSSKEESSLGFFAPAIESATRRGASQKNDMDCNTFSNRTGAAGILHPSS